jgi:hypothetical protein
MLLGGGEQPVLPLNFSLFLTKPLVLLMPLNLSHLSMLLNLSHLSMPLNVSHLQMPLNLSHLSMSSLNAISQCLLNLSNYSIFHKPSQLSMPPNSFISQCLLVLSSLIASQTSQLPLSVTLLPTACCMLHAVCCLPPAAYCLPPTVCSEQKRPTFCSRARQQRLRPGASSSDLTSTIMKDSFLSSDLY